MPLSNLARTLLAREALVQTDHSGLAFGPAARPILRGEEKVALLIPPPRRRDRKARETREALSNLSAADAILFEALRARRRELAWSRYAAPGTGLPQRIEGPSLAPAADFDAVAGVPGFVRIDAATIDAGLLGLLALARLDAGLASGPSEPLYLRAPDVTPPAATAPAATAR